MAAGVEEAAGRNRRVVVRWRSGRRVAGPCPWMNCGVKPAGRHSSRRICALCLTRSSDRPPMAGMWEGGGGGAGGVVSAGGFVRRLV